MPVNFSVDQMLSEEKHEENLEEMLKKNLELTQEIHAMTKKIKGYITFQKFMTFFYLFLIVAPIALSLMYLPGMIGPLLNNYSEMLGPVGEISSDKDFKALSPVVQQILEK